jgi:SNF2 family DNA or RNA helicase
MEKERLLEIGDSLTVANNILTSLMKLRQITSGFVIDSDITTQCLHRQKLDELLEVLEEIGDKPVIIWCNFKNEIQTIENELKKLGKSVVTAYSETKDVDVSVVEFKKGEAQYMIAHPQTLKYGVTFTQCTYAVYYSLSYSYDDYYQSHDRIYRKGQTKPCTFIFLLCHDTIDELIYEALHDKRDLADAIKEYAKGVRQD